MGARCSCNDDSTGEIIVASGCTCSEAALNEVTLTQSPSASDFVHPANVTGGHRPMLLGGRACFAAGGCVKPANSSPSWGNLNAGLAKEAAGLKETTDEVRERGSWGWPDWAVQSRTPDIEVFVVDDVAGVSRWVDAVPLCRVVDREGRDTFLSAQYCWDGEYYDEDFGPEQVRRRGSTLTVAQIL